MKQVHNGRFRMMRSLRVFALILFLAVSSSVAGAATEEKKLAAAPFAFADFCWIPGNLGSSGRPLSSKAFTGEFRFDAAYHHSFKHPKDDTISGSSEVFRHGELQVTQLGIGGDFSYKNVIGRLMTQFGMYSQTTPRNDASPARGQWNLDGAYRYLSEAYGGYHIDKWNGINVQAGIFMSYIGLWSYYNFDNWTYQPSYVSSNTPWFFNGMRVPIFPSDKLKIEPWLVNGWQSYGRFNVVPGGGGQILWRPNGWLSILGNQYFGTDTFGNKDRKRFHTDDSIMGKYYDHPAGARSTTPDATWCSCRPSTARPPSPERPTSRRIPGTRSRHGTCRSRRITFHSRSSPSGWSSTIATPACPTSRERAGPPRRAETRARRARWSARGSLIWSKTRTASRWPCWSSCERLGERNAPGACFAWMRHWTRRTVAPVGTSSPC